MWVTADHHWGHRNIARLQDRPLDHEDLMARLWHERVGTDDHVLHLGDLLVFPAVEDVTRYQALLSSLPGEKRIMLGNHDRRLRTLYRVCGFEVVAGYRERLHLVMDGRRICFSHRPDNDDGTWDVNVHGHVHSSAILPPPGRRLINACVEVTGYAPVRLRDLLSA